MSDVTYIGDGGARNLPAEIVRDVELSRGIDPERLSELPEDVFRRLMRRMQYVDLAHARQNFRRRLQRDERGSVPRLALGTALAQLDSLRTRAISLETAGLPSGGGAIAGPLLAPTAGLSGATKWISLGPANIGGRTRAIVPHPTNRNILWAGSVGGGIWRTDDAGASWRPLNDMMANLAVTCIAIDPAHPDTLYAGTGEGFGNLDAIRGAGIFVTNNGIDWRQIASTSAMQSVNRVAISHDGRTVLTAAPDGVYRSVDAVHAVWPKMLTVPMATVVFHPTDPLLAIAGGLHGDVLFSRDAGLTWTAATHAPSAWGGRVDLAYALAQPNIVYASVNVQGGQIWRSTDGGKSYTRCTATKAGRAVRFLGDQGWYDNVIWAGDPHDATFVLAGGVDLWRSTDSATTLIDISTWYADRSAHADHHCIASADPAGRLVYFGNDGGIYRTDDVRTVGNDPNLPRVHGWVNLNHNYTVTQFYDAAVSPNGILVAGAQDNGTLRYDTNSLTRNWTTMFGGDGGYCAADATDSQTVYGQYVYLNLHRSDDAGLSADFISGNFFNAITQQWDWKPAPFTIEDARTQNALFIAPFALDPNDPNVILGGGASLWRTRDAKTATTDTTGPTWSRIKMPTGSNISALAIAPQNSANVWAGYADGQLFHSMDATQNVPTWTRVGVSPAALPARDCTSITIDPADEQTVYVTFNGFTRDNVWRTRDGGATWTSISATLPQAPVRTLAVHPTKTNLLYAGTEVGVFASDDGAATWSPTNEGPTNCSVDRLIFNGATLYCATHGRGAFSIDLTNA
jgi:photosystem II stability/assembly factor-like uncharacterized protein